MAASTLEGYLNFLGWWNKKRRMWGWPHHSQDVESGVPSYAHVMDWHGHLVSGILEVYIWYTSTCQMMHTRITNDGGYLQIEGGKPHHFFRISDFWGANKPTITIFRDFAENLQSMKCKNYAFMIQYFPHTQQTSQESYHLWTNVNELRTTTEWKTSTQWQLI